MAGNVVVEHVADRRHVQTTGGNVRRHKDLQLATTELVQCGRPLRLVQIAMDRGRVDAVFVQRFRDDIHVHLAVAEDNRIDQLVTFGVDQAAQNGALFLIGAITARRFEHHHTLFDPLGRGGLTGHFDTLGRGEEGVCDPFDFRCHGGREEQRLARERREREDAFDIGDKAHVQHPVGFVHHHDLNACQQQLAAFEMVQKTARRRDQNVNALVD